MVGDKWFIKKEDGVFGPVSVDDLQNLIKNGRITLDQEASQNETGPWNPLKSYDLEENVMCSTGLKGCLKRLLLLLALTFVAGCGGSDEGGSVTVAFPDNIKERAIHCSAIFAIEQSIFTHSAEDAPYDWISKVIIEHHRDKYVPATQAASDAIMATGAFDIIDIFDIDAFTTLINDTLASFHGDTKEFQRHADICIDVFGPKE